MHSIGHFILERNPEAKVLYVTSEEFTNEVIESIRSGNASAMNKFREKYRTIDVLMIDDVQFIIGKESTQEEFFHTFNALPEIPLLPGRQTVQNGYCCRQRKYQMCNLDLSWNVWKLQVQVFSFLYYWKV